MKLTLEKIIFVFNLFLKKKVITKIILFGFVGENLILFFSNENKFSKHGYHSNNIMK